MEFKHLDDAVKSLEKSNADLQPELLSAATPGRASRPTPESTGWPPMGSPLWRRASTTLRAWPAPQGARWARRARPSPRAAVLRESAPLDDALRSGAVSLEQ